MWNEKKNYIFKKIIQNAYYLNNCVFLIFLGKKLIDYLGDSINKEKELIESELLKTSDNIILVLKILENSNQIIFERLLNFKPEKIYYRPNNNNNIFYFNNQFISVQNDKFLIYELMNFSKNIELKNNNYNFNI